METVTMYEYMAVVNTTNDPNYFASSISNEGRKGWRVVTVQQTPQGFVAFLERPVTGKS